nr:MAG: hypothetical protein [Microvirus sp.]
MHWFLFYSSDKIRWTLRQIIFLNFPSGKSKKHHLAKGD